MSDIPEATPRTDTEITRIHGHLLVPAMLSRALERELYETRRELEDLKVKHDQETCPSCRYMRSPWKPCKCGQCVRRGTNDILRAQLTAHKEVVGMCREIIEGCINNQPASEGGGMYYERFDGDGNYSGAEHVDPAAIYQATLDELHKVLAAIAKLKEEK